MILVIKCSLITLGLIFSTCALAKQEANVTTKDIAGKDTDTEGLAAYCIPCHSGIKDGMLTDPSPSARVQAVDAILSGKNAPGKTDSDATF